MWPGTNLEFSDFNIGKKKKLFVFKTIYCIYKKNVNYIIVIFLDFFF